MATTRKPAESRTQEQVFVIRTWRDGGHSGWRGRIDHLRSGKRRYIINFGDLCEFIMQMQATPEAPDAEPHPECDAP